MKLMVERDVRASAEEIKRLVSVQSHGIDLDDMQRKQLKRWLSWFEAEADSILNALEIENKKQNKRRLALI